MGSTIQSLFRLQLDKTTGDFTVQGTQSPMNGPVLNPLIGPMALAEMKSLQIKKIAFYIQGDDNRASGRLTLLYNDLKVKLMTVTDDGHLIGAGLMSFLANKALLYPDNPMPGEPVRTATPTAIRDPYKSFFNLIWKCLFTGMLQTVGRNPGVADMVNNKQQAANNKRLKSNE